MSGRVCEWCGVPILHKGVACCDSHRAKRWKWLHGNGSRPIETPPDGSPLLYGFEAVSNGRNAAERRSTSGPQVAYFKTLGILSERLAEFVEPARIEEALREALPEKQRARLETRHG